MEFIEEELTKEFLSEKLNVPVKSVSVTTGSKPGDNYMCVVYSIEAELENGTKRHLVLKAYPVQVARQQMLQVTNIFLKEFTVYDFWIPTLVKMQNDFGKPAAIKLAVPSYFGGAAVDNVMTINDDGTITQSAESTSEKFSVLQNYLLMEDVRVNGFRMADRMKGLDAQHCNLVLQQLASFHALGWVYKNKNLLGRLVDKFPLLEESMFKPGLVESFKSVFDMIVASACTMVEEALGADSIIVKNFHTFFKNDTTEIMKWFLEADGIQVDQVNGMLRVKTEYPPGYKKDPWLTLCHGDCWVNNFLFRYGDDDALPMDITLLDFQLLREACPSTDLAYFLFTSTTHATRKAHMQNFLQLYHDTFVNVCNTFEVEPFPGFSIESLTLRFRQAKLYGMIISMPLLFAVLKQSEGAVDMDKVEYDNIGDIFSKSMGIQDENFLLRERLKELATEFYEDGVL